MCIRDRDHAPHRDLPRMQSQFRGGHRQPGGITGYPLEQLFEEVAYIAYYLHWPLEDILALEHDHRREWVEKIAEINKRINEENR